MTISPFLGHIFIMSARHRARLRACVLPIVLFLVTFTLLYISRHTPTRGGSTSLSNVDAPHRFHDHDNLLLTESQCEYIFPGLTRQLDEARALGPFDLTFRNRVVLQGKIENGELYVLSGARKGDASDTMLQRQAASINQIYRAVKTSPEMLPNMSFAFGTQDQPVSTSLSYARPVISPSQRRIFPMPHFSFWSWPLPFINSLPAAQRAISAIENAMSFEEKDPRAVWRGTTWFNSGAGSHPRLRQELVRTAAGAPWGDIKGLEWTAGGREASNAINIEDFCRYRYIVQTEGIGYSGRLQFHQLCESVVLSPPLEWMQHTTHLVKPAFSSTILGTSPDHPTAYERQEWPREYPIAEANMIFVASDWSDLETIVKWLESHQDIAMRVARNQRELFHNKGYLSPAAEVCYWRSLLRVWAGLARPVGEEWDKQGIPAEEFMTGGENRR